MNTLNTLMNAVVFGTGAGILIYVAGEKGLLETLQNAEPIFLFGGAVILVTVLFTARELFNFSSSRLK